MSRHGMRRAAALLGSLVLLVPLAGCGSRVTSSRPLPDPPLATAFEADGASWSVLPMGVLSDPENTFWQLVVERHGSPRLRVVTPPGVADNGGLVESSGWLRREGRLVFGPVVGVLSSDHLGFSPIASTSDLGRIWFPSTLPLSLSRVPGSFTIGRTGSAVALLGRDGRLVVWSRDHLEDWKRLTSLRLLAAASPGCRLRALTLVSLLAASRGELALAGPCRAPGRTALLLRSPGGEIRDLGGTVAGLGHANLEPLALLPGRNGALVRISLLALVTSGASTSLDTVSRSARGRWKVSSHLAVPKGERLIALGADPLFALVATGHVAPRPERLYEPEGQFRGSWRLVARPPAGTQSLLFHGEHLTALVVHRSLLLAERPTQGRWRVVSRLNVPIAYGSSS